ncbi:MAG: ATPase, partial [Rhodococcus sp. (in: high G+C Gram-positive bacteria)]
GTIHANSPAEVPARLEALAALGGMDRAALHSQLSAALQVVLHVHRGADGRRRLREIAVVTADEAGRVSIMQAWSIIGTAWPGRARLDRLLAERGELS